METQDEFFSRKHKQLLSIATWAKYLAWVILIVYVFYTLGTYTQEQVYYSFNRGTGFQIPNFNDYMASNLTYKISVFIELLGIFLKGILYFLILKGISLGLNMIVETDINYRDQKGSEQ